MYGHGMRGYGGGGYGHGGRGLGYRPGVGQVPPTPAGYAYVGACRCGYGPRAYYQDASGRVLPAAQVLGGAVTPPAAPGQDEIDRLRAEKAELELRLSELEQRLQDVS